jgi:hypothetical protein
VRRTGGRLARAGDRSHTRQRGVARTAGRGELLLLDLLDHGQSQGAGRIRSAHPGAQGRDRHAARLSRHVGKGPAETSGGH